MDRLRTISTYYGALLRATPGHVWRAADVVSRLALLFVLLLFAFFGYRGDIPVPLLIALLIVVVVVALAVTEYDRYDAVRSARDELVRKDTERIQKSVENFRHDWAWEELGSAMSVGRDTLWKPLRLETGGDERDWVAKVDKWETSTREMVHKHWVQYEAFYVSDTGLVATVLDWRARLDTLMDIKLNRLFEMMTRDIKSRNPGMVFDDERPQSGSPAISSQVQT